MFFPRISRISICGGFKDDPVVTCTWNTLLFQLDISVKTCIQWPTPKTMTKNCPKKKIQESMASLWHSSRRRHFQTFGTRENCGGNCSITHPKWIGSCWTTFLLGHVYFGSPHGGLSKTRFIVGFRPIREASLWTFVNHVLQKTLQDANRLQVFQHTPFLTMGI